MVNENAEHVAINIQRKHGDLSQPLDVKCTTLTSNNSLSDRNVQKAVEIEDYIPVEGIIRFLPGEQNKVS